MGSQTLKPLLVDCKIINNDPGMDVPLIQINHDAHIRCQAFRLSAADLHQDLAVQGILKDLRARSGIDIAMDR